MKILSIVKWNPDSDEAMSVVDVLDAVKAYWKWDYEEANIFFIFDENNEELQTIAQGFLNYANQFIS